MDQPSYRELPDFYFERAPHTVRSYFKSATSHATINGALRAKTWLAAVVKSTDEKKKKMGAWFYPIEMISIDGKSSHEQMRI